MNSPQSVPDQTALEALYGHYRKTFDLWQAAGISVPPCFIVVCNNTSTSKLVYDYIGGFTRPAKPFTPAQQQLFGAVRDAGALIGQQITWAPSGGVCEGNNLFAAGLPNVDTLGVRGGDIHSEAEYAWPDSFVERAQLSALILAKVASGEIDAHALKQLRLETA